MHVKSVLSKMCLQTVTKLGQGKESDAMPKNQSIVLRAVKQLSVYDRA